MSFNNKIFEFKNFFRRLEEIFFKVSEQIVSNQSNILTRGMSGNRILEEAEVRII